MQKPEKTTILLTLFTILTLISIITVYAVHQDPTQETTMNTLCTYRSTAAYNYTATLEPSIICDNKTTLRPNEGTLYAKITKQVNMTLNYTFEANLPTEVTITYNMTQTLTPWQHQIAETTQTTTNKKQIQIAIPLIKTDELEALKSQIQTETGLTSSTYALQITPTFKINANTTAGPIHQIFTPTLLIDFKHTDKGDIIAIEDLDQTKTDAITESQTITRFDVMNQRYASYILVTISVAGLFFSTYLYRKATPETKKKSLDRIIAPYRDLIIEAVELPRTTPETATINVGTMKELVRTAEILVKPIVLTRKPEPTLAVMDQNVMYTHKPQ